MADDKKAVEVPVVKTVTKKEAKLYNHEPKVRAFALIGLVFLSVGGGFLGGWLGAGAKNNQGQTVQEKRQIVSTESDVISQLVKDVGPSVVSVNVKSQGTSNSFFGFGQPVEQESAGTGFIISKEGVIVTNRHVVDSSATSVSVTLSDGTELDDVKVIGRTNDSDPLDVAFLKINDAKGKTLVPATLGDSAQVAVGNKVVAIGNALGQFQNTVTSGIISGYGRSLEAGDASSSESLQNLFQTDTAINQGNSGGPLMNLSGEVIGINTAVAGNAENVGFSIPINDIKGLITSVLDKGELLRPYLGVRYVQLTDDYAYTYNLSVKRGAYIAPSANGQSSILADSPAAKAGLKEKDIITKIDGDVIDEKNSLISIVSKHAVNDEVTLTVIRDGKEQSIKVKLEAAPKS
jgi:serine protease Do